MDRTTHRQRRKKWYTRVLPLILGGIFLNLAGKAIAGRMSFTLYLDSVGTVLASVLGGYLPGIIVGYCSNLILGFEDITNIYYGSINALIAVAAAYFSAAGYWKKGLRPLIIIPVLALIGGGLGSLLTWCLFGFSFDPGVKLAVQFYQSGLSPFWAQLNSAFLIDLLDKGIVVLLTMAVLSVMPERWKRSFLLENWKQKPLPEDLRSAAQNASLNPHSLRTRVMAGIAVAVLLVTAAFLAVYAVLYHSSIVNESMTLGRGIAKLIASNIDPRQVDSYLLEGENAEGYHETERRLYDIRKSYADVQYIYVYRILPDGCHVVFDLDTADLPGAEPGELVEFDDSFSDYIPALLRGEEIEPLVTNDTFGWLLTVYEPVRDGKGVCQCYAAVDISMDRLTANEVGFMTRGLSMFLGLFLMIMFLGVWVVEYSFVLPINSMTLTVSGFAYDNENDQTENVNRYHNLKISTGDEIESLYTAVGKTIDDSVRFAENIQTQGETIAKMQRGLIMVLADLVESRDKCTGDHVRKTAAYTGIIMDHMRRRGDTRISDEFYHNVVNSAPLHDVGKIHVSDAILNKPGRLTEEEFEKMKEHTTVGGGIIDQAIEMVGGESGYLDEAKNLAVCHHERWDGTGYPKGLAGEEIPLSARIMAVADVFDALVSRRSYKEPFPFEKAMDIIREGAGTQFDPVVTAAFLEAEDEVRRVSEAFLGENDSAR